MESIVDDILGQLSGPQLGQMASSLGVESDQMEGMVAAALPALLGGLTNNASTPAGAGSLLQALQKDHDGSLLDASDLLGSIDATDGGKILGHIFGGQQSNVEQTLAQRTGSNQSLIAQLLPLLAPLVMAWLGRKQRSTGVDAGGLGDILGQQRQQTQQSMPDLSDLLDLLGGGAGSAGRAQAPSGGPAGAPQTGRQSRGGGLFGMLKDLLGGRR